MKTTIPITYVIAAIFLLNSPLRASELSEAIEADYGRLDSLFRHFHANPELSMQEFETSERLAAELEVLGFEVRRNINETGLVGTMRNGDGPSLVIRADMDGLPVQENSDLEYASTARQVNLEGIEMPVMHACGHDMHVTTLIGVAKQLANNKDKWRGSVHLVGQPAEEALGGTPPELIESGTWGPHHSPLFKIDSEASIKAGVEAMTLAAMELLGRP